MNRLVVALCLLTAGLAFGGEAALVVDGHGFVLRELRDGALAYANRQYVWKGVPAAFRGWQFTQTHGGAPARITVTARTDTTVHIATVASQKDGVDLTGWEGLAIEGFSYTTSHGSPMALYRRTVKAGTPLVIPQGNWSGCLVLAPSLKMGKRIAPPTTPVPGVVIDT
ncbi:hypothetical protein HQ576_02955, partial [bacterium]|nr:hypothetical protein [bacterium]